MGYAKVNYNRKALRVNFFTNLVSAEAPNLLLPDPATGRPLQLNFSTETYDFEVGDSVVAPRQVVTFGGNVRQNDFDITIAPDASNRTELIKEKDVRASFGVTFDLDALVGGLFR